ncbi:MAG TPA: peptidylprolyl isomerase [Aggregatilineaceae bacterium]|nr:peptidylprolyl isomerase [Aggregatilineaceae bacterium]
MRSVHVHRLIFVLVVILLLVACGKSDSKSSSDSDQGAPHYVADRAVTEAVTGDTVQAAEVTPSGDPLAALVNSEPITLAEFERERARIMQFQQVEPATAEAFDAMVLQGMIEQALIEQYAAQQNIVVTDAEVDVELAAQAELAAASGITLEDYIGQQLYTMDEYRDAQRKVLLANKVRDVITANVPTTAAQVHARHILVADEATARSLIDQLNQGADFAQLAATYSLDQTSARTGGDLAWVSEGDLLQPEVEAAIFSIQPGTRSTEPVRSTLGYHVIEVLERVEGRPLDQAALAEKRNQAFQAWMRTQYQAADIQRFVGSDPIS